MDLNYFIKLMKILLDGTKVSLRIFAITLIFAIPLGILVSALSISKNKIISKIIKLYILLMRGTPLLLQIICIYFAPYYLFKFSYNRFIAVIIAFTLNYAAYFGEIFRGVIESIPKGQWEFAINSFLGVFNTPLQIPLPTSHLSHSFYKFQFHFYNPV